jgi:acetolactate synthase-1/3 small subunit
MKKSYTLSVFTENKVGLLNRITAMFTRQHINIDSIAASESEIDGIHRYTIVVTEDKIAVQKLVKQIEKQVDVLKAFFHEEEDTVYQEIALYKLPIDITKEPGFFENLVRKHNIRIISIEKEFLVLEKTGHRKETQKLLELLQPLGLLEFVRSGRVAVTKPMATLESFLN